MDETTRAIIDSITITYTTPTRIPGGKQCTVFYDCVRLNPNELARLAAQATGHLSEDTFDAAIGLAYSGVFFAAAIAGGKHIAILKADGDMSGPVLKGLKVVLVDDVVSSGTRLLEAEKKVQAIGATVVGYACIVDRSDGKFGSATKPLWSAYQTNMI